MCLIYSLRAIHSFLDYVLTRAALKTELAAILMLTYNLESDEFDGEDSLVDADVPLLNGDEDGVDEPSEDNHKGETLDFGEAFNGELGMLVHNTHAHTKCIIFTKISCDYKNH